MSAKFEIDYEQLEQLEQKMMRLPGKMEGVVNDTLHTDGIKIATDEITQLIPVSKRKVGKGQKNHAKTSKWSKSEKHNLGFTIKPKGGAAKNKGSFGYLVFPDKGIGPHNLIEQGFMEKGLEKATDKILGQLNENIDKTLEEEL